jgi:beta-lactamase regulating signal transducer with metallopeptidase domain
VTEALIGQAAGNLLLSAALALPAWLVHRRGRSPALAHALWVLALLKAITPPLLIGPLPAGLGLPMDGLRSMLGASVIGTTVVRPPDAGVAAGVAAASGATDPGPAGLPLSLDLATALLTVWVLGSLVVLVISSRRIRRFDRLVSHRTRTAPPGMVALARGVADELGLRSMPSVVLSEARLSPMTWRGSGGLRVILPVAVLALGPAHSRWVLAHELAHVRRRDHLVRWLEWAACIVAWWNPVVWLARTRLRVDEEDACDALVVERLAGPRRAYAGALLDVVEILASPEPMRLTMTTGIDAAGSLEHRLMRIMAEPRPAGMSRVASVGVATAAMAVMVLGISSGRSTSLTPTFAAEAAAPGAVAQPGQRYGWLSGRRASSAPPAARAVLVGTAGADLLHGTAASDSLAGRGGADRLAGGAGRDVVRGGSGADTIAAGLGDDLVFGGRGDDVIDAGPGDDVVRGGAGDDVITAGAGADIVHGGSGDDLIRTFGDGASDSVDCGLGHDRAVVDAGDTTQGCEVVLVRD